jgi:hypothetical protein
MDQVKWRDLTQCSARSKIDSLNPLLRINVCLQS